MSRLGKLISALGIAAIVLLLWFNWILDHYSLGATARGESLAIEFKR